MGKMGRWGREVDIEDELKNDSGFIVVDRNFEGYGRGGSEYDYGDIVRFFENKEELFNYLLWDKYDEYVESLEEEGIDIEYEDYDDLVNKSMEEKREILIKVMEEVGDDEDKDGFIWNKCYIIEFERK